MNSLLPMVKKNRQQCPHTQQQGAAMVEAAIVLPFGLSFLFITMNTLLFCFRLLQFQYEVSEITRQAFILNASQRRNLSGKYNDRGRQSFITTKINQRAKALGLSTPEPANRARIAFASSRGSRCLSWQCSASALPGDVFTIELTITEDILGGALSGISWTTISSDVKAVAFVQTSEDEARGDVS